MGPKLVAIGFLRRVQPPRGRVDADGPPAVQTRPPRARLGPCGPERAVHPGSRHSHRPRRRGRVQPLRPQDGGRRCTDRNPAGPTELPAGFDLDHRQAPFFGGTHDRLCDPAGRIPGYEHDHRAASRDGLGRLMRSDNPLRRFLQGVQRHGSQSSLPESGPPPDNLSEHRRSAARCQCVRHAAPSVAVIARLARNPIVLDGGNGRRRRGGVGAVPVFATPGRGLRTDPRTLSRGATFRSWVRTSGGSTPRGRSL